MKINGSYQAEQIVQLNINASRFAIHNNKIFALSNDGKLSIYDSLTGKYDKKVVIDLNEYKDDFNTNEEFCLYGNNIFILSKNLDAIRILEYKFTESGVEYSYVASMKFDRIYSFDVIDKILVVCAKVNQEHQAQVFDLEKIELIYQRFGHYSGCNLSFSKTGNIEIHLFNSKNYERIGNSYPYIAHLEHTRLNFDSNKKLISVNENYQCEHNFIFRHGKDKVKRTYAPDGVIDKIKFKSGKSKIGIEAYADVCFDTATRKTYLIAYDYDFEKQKTIPVLVKGE